MEIPDILLLSIRFYTRTLCYDISSNNFKNDGSQIEQNQRVSNKLNRYSLFIAKSYDRAVSRLYIATTKIPNLYNVSSRITLGNIILTTL